MRRSASVTVVAVLLILGAVVGIADMALRASHPSHDVGAAEIGRHFSLVPARVSVAMGFATALLNLLAGVLLLRRQVLGRTLYAVVGALALAEAALTTRGVALPFVAVPLLIYAVFMALLFRPSSTRWFRARHG